VEQRGRPRSVRSARRILYEYLEHDLRTQFVAEYLTKVDGATMWHALEARSPFLDQKVWEFAASLPLELRLRGGQLKPLLRELARRRISERVAVQRKQGFGVPVQAWVAGRWRAEVEARFNDSLLARGGWIDADAALRELRRTPEGGQVPLQLWYLYALECWMQADAARGPQGSGLGAPDSAAATRSATALAARGA
jgi:asparagine synthase (glutamine-hydrolysing)